MWRRKRLSDFPVVVEVAGIDGPRPIEETDGGYRFHPEIMDPDTLYVFPFGDGQKRGVVKTSKGRIAVYDVV